MRSIIVLFLGGCMVFTACSDGKNKAAEASKAAIESLNSSEEQKTADTNLTEVSEPQNAEDLQSPPDEDVWAAKDVVEDPAPQEELYSENVVEESQQPTVRDNAPSENVVSSEVSDADLSSFSEKFGFTVTSSDDRELFAEVVTWLGTPYLSAGNDKNGADCSGFICSVYQTVYDKKLPRRTCEIYDKCKTIPLSDVKAGDLVFFRPDGKMDEKPNYAGIYLKDNKFVIVSSSKGVTIADMGTNYYKKTFVSAAQVQY
ncbi:MAG: C40 family peptidase [Paludibacteraceae bacterium]|nr:C40 family peptidase [Paludibacteraceae bacterium]